MRWPAWIVAVTVAAWVTVAAKAAPAWQGELAGGVIAGSGTRDLDDQSSYLGFTAAAKGSVASEGWRGWGRGTLDVPHDGPQGTADGRLTLRELALRGERGRWAATLGRQKITWGRADGVNPTNVLGWRDFGRPAIWDDELYRGVDAARLDRRLSSRDQFSLFAVSRWRASRLPAALEAQLSALGPGRSDAIEAGRPAWALRYETLREGFDAALTVARVADSTPYLRPDPEAPSLLQRRYGESRLLGADFAWSRDPWVFRGEFAQLWREEAPTAPRDELTAILAAEREIGEQVNINVQWIRSRYRDFVPPAALGPLAQAAVITGVLFHQQRAADTGASLNLTLRPSNQVGSLQVSVIGYRGGESLFRLRGEYPHGERGKLELLAEHYRGPAGSSFETLARNNGVWLRWSYTWSG